MGQPVNAAFGLVSGQALPMRVLARLGWLPSSFDSKVAIIEMASASGLALVPARGSSAPALEREAEAAHLPGFLTFYPPQAAISKITSTTTKQISPFWALQRGLLFVSFVTLLSTLLLVGLQRRREFGLLAAVGLTPGELFTMVLVEAVAIGVVGAVLGVVMGAVLMEALLSATPIFVGFQDTYVLDPGAALVYGPIAVVVAAAASIWPGWRAARIPVIQALAYE
jgi:putative ABC transport system permease protein